MGRFVMLLPIIIAILAGCDDAKMEKAKFTVQCEELHPSGDKAALDACVAEKFAAAHRKLQ
jgi:hypothetical protein